MMARWDVLLVAAVLSAGSVMIENSHRVDTGLAEAPLPACTEPGDTASVPDNASDTHFVVSAAHDDAALTACD